MTRQPAADTTGLPAAASTATDVPPPPDPTRRLRAVSYLRVSGDSQVNTDYDPEGISLPAQRRKIRDKVQQMGADVLEEYVEPGKSAYKDLPKREAFLAMIERIEQRRDVDLVVVYQLSRFARNRYEDAIFSMTLRRLGVLLVSATENIDETPVGMLVHGILASVNEFQSAASGKDISFKMSEKARRGGTPGRAPVGYLNVREQYDGRDVRTVALDPDRWEHVEWAFEQYATGRYTLASITAALEARGLTNRATAKFPERPMHQSHVHKMLTNPYYVGVVRFDGAAYEGGRHPTVVTRATFDRVQAILHARKNSGEKPRRHFHHLKGSLFCGECGSRMGITNATGRWGTVYPYFYCLGRQNRRLRCTQPHVLVEAVEQHVEHWWARVSLTDTQRARVRDLVTESARTVAAHGHTEATRQQNKIRKLEDDRRKLLRLHFDDNIDEDLFKEEQDRIRRDLATARRVLDTCQAQWEALEDAVDQILLLCHDSQTLYRSAPDVVKQQLNQTVFDRFYVLGRTLAGADLRSPLAQLLADDLETRLALEADALVNHARTTAAAADTTPTTPTNGHVSARTPETLAAVPSQRPYGRLPRSVMTLLAGVGLADSQLLSRHRGGAASGILHGYQVVGRCCGGSDSVAG